MLLAEIAKELGVSRPTLNKFRAAGCPITDLAAARGWIARYRAASTRGGKVTGAPLSTREDLQREAIRKTAAEADLKEYEVRKIRENLVSMDTARAYVVETLGALRALLDQLPVTAGPRANPADPQLGEQVIRESLDALYRAMERTRDAGAGQPRETGANLGANAGETNVG